MSTVLQAQERKDMRRSALKKIRDNGNIPAVIYGARVENKPVFVSSADLTKTIRQSGRNGIISLDVDGHKVDVILSDYQADSINGQIIHIDFLAVDKKSNITVDVRLVLTGEAAGVKDGGVLQQVLHELPITTTPDQIPPQIEVDVTNLQVGETTTVGDILHQGDFTINLEDDTVIASILPPKQEEEINAGEQQEGGHPVHEEGRETEPLGKE
ncbi:50S ribosomal protein L25/general stress protein Ctc [Neobacillus sp. OS1-32]|jgi:large subunit ribosomal protein L25|uniref:Large ribosomal subunit protein bL25 n=1 Tax=Neobacillus paridis TaxID=2803862 RepID=A0ABS1TSB4_9BACI|nr:MULTISPECIES: 50S ribosomal protein L25/general stress protein Ctc [Neobacillus]MBL4954207.1 50S ribosomal protein L25/general stress protein Ctc [Neobacillus paridis]WML29483.1 50S ribosomal protein L25/general stress protein Ctc [Neobacillus sp. OS1-32]